MRARGRVLLGGLCALLCTAVVGAAEPEEVDPELAGALEADRQPSAEVAPTGGLEGLMQAVPLRNMNPRISLILDAALGWFTQQEHLRQGGHAPDENGFTLQGLELAASASVDPYFRFDLNFELAHIELEEVSATTLGLPFGLQLRGGRFYAAFGREGPLHLHAWKFANPSLLRSRFLGDEGFGGVGLEASWLAPLPWYLLLTVQAFDTHEGSDFMSSTFGTVESTFGGTLDGLEDFAYLARLQNFFELSADWSLDVGLSGAWGQSPFAPDGRAALYGADIYLKWRPISAGRDQLAVALTLEYALRQVRVPGEAAGDHGGYAQLDVQLAKRWLVGLRADNLGVGWGPSPDPELLGGWQWRGAVAVTFLPSHFSKIRLQLDTGRAQGQPDPVLGVFLQVEVSAGEHGAHRF